MLIALLALLGVDLIAIVILLGVVLSRKRWVSHQPAAFKGAIRVVEGEVSGLSAKWKHGYGRWVRDILVWKGSVPVPKRACGSRCPRRRRSCGQTG